MLILIIALVGCVKETEITEEELIERVAAAAEEIETHQFDMDMLAHHYNEPVSIELPPEAEEAPEVPMPK